jgi:hypothetical protein
MMIMILTALLFSPHAKAETKLTVDITMDKVQFQKPPKGVGRAGTLIFKSANVNNNGIVLNINNVNNYFDSQIFVRPTFLGFTTQFGNYGFALEPDSIINSIVNTELINGKLLFDDAQLNLSGESLNFMNADSSIKLAKFRLYCQNTAAPVVDAAGTTEAPSNDMMKSCLNFLTLNGNYMPGNEAAALEYEGVDLKTNEKTFVQTKVRSVDLRKTEINASLLATKSVSNDSYIINASNVELNCAKDEDLAAPDFEKIKKTCLNRFKLGPVKASLVDKIAKSTFNLDVKDVTVKEKILYFTLNSGALSDAQSTTSLFNVLLNCRKETDSDLLELMDVLKDCTSYARVSIGEIRNSKPDDKKDSSIKNIAINASNNALVTTAEVKFLGITARVSIYGNVTLDTSKKQLNITVTDTKLPLGINSVKLLMYFLKKNLISKDIFINNNIITVQL